MSYENLLVGAGFGGAAGSALTLIVSHMREKQKEKTLIERVRALVTFELRSVRDLIQYRMLDTHKSDSPKIYFAVGSTEVQRADRIIESLQYPEMKTEIKLSAFDSALLNELQDVYLQIRTISAYRSHVNDVEFLYHKADLERWRDAIDAVIKKIDDKASSKPVSRPIVKKWPAWSFAASLVMLGFGFWASTFASAFLDTNAQLGIGIYTAGLFLVMGHAAIAAISYDKLSKRVAKLEGNKE